MTTTPPKTAKKPADRKPKAEKADGPQVLEVELRGKTWRIEPGSADDFELLEDLGEADRTRDPQRLPGILKRILGHEQYREALDTIRDSRTGRVSVQAGTDFVLELFEAMNPNSSGSQGS